MKNPFPLVKRAVSKTLSKLGRMILFGSLKNKKGTENIPRDMCIRKRWNAPNLILEMGYHPDWLNSWKWALFPSHLDQLLSSLGITKDWGQRPIPYLPPSFTRDRFWAEYSYQQCFLSSSWSSFTITEDTLTFRDNLQEHFFIIGN